MWYSAQDRRESIGGATKDSSWHTGTIDCSGDTCWDHRTSLIYFRALYSEISLVPAIWLVLHLLSFTELKRMDPYAMQAREKGGSIPTTGF